jgi:signal transduction histidine kinase
VDVLPGHRWVRLFVLARLTSTGVAVALLAAHQGTPHDTALALVGLAYGALTAAAAWSRPALFASRAAWALDTAVALVLVLGSEDWRSPFYLLALTTLAAPAASLPLPRALAWGIGFTVAYGVIAVVTGIDVRELRTSARLDTLATHLLLPLVATAGAAYSAEALRRLAAERARAERLAVETERRRIAWELHDSAKQRLHAAALMLSASEPDPLVAGALQELQGATADMETSIAELRSPLEGRPLAEALRDRAAELQPLTGAAIRVDGAAPALPAVTATHVYRIVAEAMTNAVRHAHAAAIHVRLGAEGGALRATVVDDGDGLPERTRPGAGGLLTMRSRAFAIGGRLTVEPGPGDRGTRVGLDLPLHEGAVPR